MARVVVTEFVSLDGVMEDPGGGEDFEHGGWSFAFDRGDEGNAFKTGETMDAAAMLLGRRTYEGFAAAWPGRSGEFADKFNGMPKYVVSSTLENPEWGGTTVLRGDLAEAVGRVKEQHEEHLIVHGSAQLVHELLELDLVDELRLMVFPVVLGKGKSLWGPTSGQRTFKLTESATVGEGVLTLVLQKV